jgi:hypothetical protein
VPRLADRDGFEAEQRSKLGKLRAHVAHAHRAVVGRAMTVPTGYELSRAAWEAIPAVGIADF